MHQSFSGLGIGGSSTRSSSAWLGLRLATIWRATSRPSLAIRVRRSGHFGPSRWVRSTTPPATAAPKRTSPFARKLRRCMRWISGSAPRLRGDGAPFDASGFSFRGLEHGFQGDDLAQRGVTRTGDAGDRIERLGFDLAVLQQPVPDMEDQHFADDEPAAGLAEFEALPETALHRNRSCGE